jgi:hypothetical protein
MGSFVPDENEEPVLFELWTYGHCYPILVNHSLFC